MRFLFVEKKKLDAIVNEEKKKNYKKESIFYFI